MEFNMKKYFLLLSIFILLVSCSINSNERKFAVLSNKKIETFNANDVKLEDFEYKYCDGVILLLIPTGFKARNENYVMLKGIDNYNKKHKTNYNAIINATVSTENNFYIPFYYNGCTIIKGKITNI